MSTDNKQETLNYIVPEDTFGPEFRYIRGFVARISNKVKLALLISLILLANFAGFYIPKAAATTGDMLLFWDPLINTFDSSISDSIPAGWCNLTIYNGYFPMGYSSFGTDYYNGSGTQYTVPSTPYTVSSTGTTLGPASATDGDTGSTFDAAPTTDLPYSPVQANDVTFSNDFNGTSYPDLPAFRNLELIEYVGTGSAYSGTTCTNTNVGDGIPTTLPAGVVAFYNNYTSTTLPTGWNYLSAQASEMVQIGTSDTTGGADFEENYVTVSGERFNTSDEIGVNNQGLILDAAIESPTYGEAPPSTWSQCIGNGTATTSTACGTGDPTISCPLQGSAGTTDTSTSEFLCTNSTTDPPYVQPVFAYSTSSTPTLTSNISAMFDGSPGPGWTVLSNSGGEYYDYLMRGAATPNVTTPAGQATRTSYFMTGTLGTFIDGSSPGTVLDLLDNNVAATPSAHRTVSVPGETTSDSMSNLPPTLDVIVAQKVSFTLENYEWFADNELITPSNGWPNSSLHTGIDAGIPAIPAPYDPPTNNQDVRLRVQMLVGDEPLTANGTGFMLQYQETTDSTCLAGSWTNVDVAGSGTGVWRYGTITGSITNDEQLTNTVFYPPAQTNPSSNILETFSNAATGNDSPDAAATGDTIEYDWLIQDNGANPGSRYAFRVVEQDGEVLGSYYNDINQFQNECPWIVTAPSTAQELRHGEFFQDGADEGFEWAN